MEAETPLPQTEPARVSFRGIETLEHGLRAVQGGSRLTTVPKPGAGPPLDGRRKSACHGWRWAGDGLRRLAQFNSSFRQRAVPEIGHAPAGHHPGTQLPVPG